MVFDSDFSESFIPFVTLVIMVFCIVLYLEVITIPCASMVLLLSVIWRFSMTQLSALMVSMGTELFSL